MGSEVRHFGSAPPLPPDESYWAALLQEGESPTDEGGPQADDEWLDAQDYPLRPQHANPDSETEDVETEWEHIRKIFDSDSTIELDVIGYNRGGLLVGWNNLRGFVPASQLIGPSVSGNDNRHDVLAKYVGHTIKLRVIELDHAQNRLILSERAAQVQPGTRAAVLNNIQPGDVCRGLVTNLCDFGVFVDLGGIEGLIHISELSWGRVGHPRDILNRGETIEVYVMSVDPAQERVALSLKRLRPDPWQTVEDHYRVGQVVEGQVTNVVDFGAFVCIEDGLEGLIHVSELAEGHFLHPRNVVNEGDVVKARILNIDGRARRLGLSLRR